MLKNWWKNWQPASYFIPKKNAGTNKYYEVKAISDGIVVQYHFCRCSWPVVLVCCFLSHFGLPAKNQVRPRLCAGDSSVAGLPDRQENEPEPQLQHRAERCCRLWKQPFESNLPMSTSIYIHRPYIHHIWKHSNQEQIYMYIHYSYNNCVYNVHTLYLHAKFWQHFLPVDLSCGSKSGISTTKSFNSFNSVRLRARGKVPWLYGCFQKQGEFSPQNAWFISWKTPKKDGWSGWKITIFGNINIFNF